MNGCLGGALTKGENQVDGDLGATQEPWRTPAPAVTTGQDLSAVPLSCHVYSTSGMDFFPEEASQRARLDIWTHRLPA